MSIEIIVGRLGRAHGIRGEIAVEPRTDEPERRFAAGAVLRGEGTRQTFTVEGTRRHAERLLVRFAELPDRTAAEAARGTVLVTDVPDDEAPAEDDEFYDRQLVGLDVMDAHGAIVGRVRGVTHLAQDLLEIATDHGVRLVPFVEALVPEVDVAAGRLRLADVAGLITDEPDAAGDGPEAEVDEERDA